MISAKVIATLFSLIASASAAGFDPTNPTYSGYSGPNSWNAASPNNYPGQPTDGFAPHHSMHNAFGQGAFGGMPAGANYGPAPPIGGPMGPYGTQPMGGYPGAPGMASMPPAGGSYPNAFDPTQSQTPPPQGYGFPSQPQGPAMQY